MQSVKIGSKSYNLKILRQMVMIKMKMKKKILMMPMKTKKTN